MRTRKARSFATAMALGTVAFAGAARAQDVPNVAPNVVALPEVYVVSPTPVPGGSVVDRNTQPAFISTVTGQQFSDKKSPAVTDALTDHVPAAIAIDVDGTDLLPRLFLPWV